MLKAAKINNFTVFSNIDLNFGEHLNVFIGENGTGKTHILKLLYSVLASSAKEGRKPTAPVPTKNVYQGQLAQKLMGVFRPESLGRLTRRKQGRERCDVEILFGEKSFDIAFSFATNSKSEVVIEKLPEAWISVFPAYFPTRELMTIFPNFVSVYESHYLEFEEIWRDICVLLGAPVQRGPKEHRIKSLLEPLEKAMDGSIELDKSGHFYLKTATGRMEMPLVAEGMRKIGMLSRLIATGTLLEQGYLFWDEPEANLNAQLVERIAQSILELSFQGIQIFFATHSLFLLRELEMLIAHSRRNGNNTDAKFFGLHKSDEFGVIVQQGSNIDEIGDISALNAELAQSDRFMELEDDAAN